MKRLRRLSIGLGVAGLLLAVSGIAGAQTAPATAKDPKATKEKKGGKTAPAAPVDLNTATQAELESVPGIGEATAKKIIAGRPFTSVSDLSKAGLSAKQIASISSMVKVGTAAAPAAKMAPPIQTPAQPPATANPATAAKAKTATGNAANVASGTPAPGGGPGMVWVNTETKVFHRQGDKWYGLTKHGKYMSEADATKAGYHESKEKTKQ